MGALKDNVIGDSAVEARLDAQYLSQTSCVETIEFLPLGLVHACSLQAIGQLAHNTRVKHGNFPSSWYAGVRPESPQNFEASGPLTNSPAQLRCKPAISGQYAAQMLHASFIFDFSTIRFDD